MKRFVIVALGVLFITLLPSTLFAQEKTTRILRSDQKIDKVYFAAGDTVSLQGTVNNDAYVAGSTVDVGGTVMGDLIAAGGTVNLRGTVGQDVRVAGGTVNISGDIKGNVTVAGGTVNIAKDTKINGTVIVGTGTFNNNGPIAGDLFMGAGSALLNSSVGGDVNAGVGEMTIGKDSLIKGNLAYSSEKSAIISQNSKVGGSVNFHKTEPAQEKSDSVNRQAFGGAFIFGKIISLAMMFLVGLALLNYVPVFSQQVVASVRKNKVKNMLNGFLLLIAIPMISILLTITLVGIPFAIVLLFSYFLLFYFAKIFVAFFLGELILKKFNYSPSNSLTLFTGLLAHLILTLIPLIGWLIGGIVMVWGAGAFVSTKISVYKSLRAKKLI